MINCVVSGVPVRDHAAACKWYAGWLGRDADVVPVEDIAEWKLCENGWIQLFVDEERAGSTVVLIGVTDLEEQMASLRRAGVEVGEVQDYPGLVRTADVTDPDGNVLSFVQEYS